MLRSITTHLKESEKRFLFEVMKEELKRLRQQDITLEGETKPRPLTYINRDFFDLSTENLRALDVIKDPIALETPLHSLNYLIDNISLEQDTVLAIKLMTKCFDSRTSEADLIVDKIDKIIFHTTDYIKYNASIIGLLLEVQYGGQTSKGLKYFEQSDKFVLELRRIFRHINFRTPIQDVYFINRKLLAIVNTEISRNSLRDNRDNLQLLNELKTEIENNQN
jgi:hypothetical protein